MQLTEKRAYARKKIDFELSIVSATREGLPIQLPPGFRAQGFEIAEAGCGMRSSHVWLRGDLLRLELTLPGESRRLKIAAQVRNLRKGPQGPPAAHALVGLSFVELSESDRRYLSNYLGSTFLIY